MLARRPRVLVVESRDAMAATITSALSEAGCLATITASFDGAIRAAKELSPGLALVHLTPAVRSGGLVAMALGDELPRVRVVGYGCKLDGRWFEKAECLGIRCPVLDEERITEWIALTVPRLTKLVRLEGSVRIRTRGFVLRAGTPTASFPHVNLNGVVRELEEAAIRAALKHARGRQREAARLLSISESSLRAKMAKYSIDR